MFDMKRFALFLSEKRKKKNITQGQLADMMGVSHQAVSKWERGESMPEISKLASLSDAISVPADEILAAMNSNDVSSTDHNKCLDDQYFALPDKSLVGDVYELAPYLSNDTLTKAIIEIVVSKGSEIASVLFQFADQKTLSLIAERAFEMDCTKGRAHLLPYLSESTLTKVVLNKYANNEQHILAQLIPMIKNEKVLDLVFEICVDKYDGTWNLLRPYISEMPDSIVIKHGIKIAVRVGPGCFNSWWHLLGKDTSAEILAGYCQRFDYNPRSIQDISRFIHFCNKDIVEKYFKEAVQSGVDVQCFVYVYHLVSDETKRFFDSKNIDVSSYEKKINDNLGLPFSSFFDFAHKNSTDSVAEENGFDERITEIEEALEFLTEQIAILRNKIENMEKQ